MFFHWCESKPLFKPKPIHFFAGFYSWYLNDLLDVRSVYSAQWLHTAVYVCRWTTPPKVKWEPLPPHPCHIAHSPLGHRQRPRAWIQPHRDPPPCVQVTFLWRVRLAFILERGQRQWLRGKRLNRERQRGRRGRRRGLEKKKDRRGRAGTKGEWMCVVCEGKMNGGGLKKLTVRLVCLSFCASHLVFLVFLLCLSTGNRTGVIMQGDFKVDCRLVRSIVHYVCLCH